jgi:two-component system chemotaxis response regulator CheY
MKTLIVEDDFTSRLLLQAFLSAFGECDVAANGNEAIDLFRMAQRSGAPYDLICMDILMPEMDGHTAVKTIRALGERRLVPPHHTRIIMTTSLSDRENVARSINELCDAYLIKPVDTGKLLNQLKSFGLLQAEPSPQVPEATENYTSES